MKAGARRRGYVWRLTDDQAIALISKPCFYCGKEGGGIDRWRNEVGYTPKNCLPCCWPCNKAKNTRTSGQYIRASKDVARVCVSREDFIARSKKINDEIEGLGIWPSSSSNAANAKQPKNAEFIPYNETNNFANTAESN